MDGYTTNEKEKERRGRSPPKNNKKTRNSIDFMRFSFGSLPYKQKNKNEYFMLPPTPSISPQLLALHSISTLFWPSCGHYGSDRSFNERIALARRRAYTSLSTTAWCEFKKTFKKHQKKSKQKDQINFYTFINIWMVLPHYPPLPPPPPLVWNSPPATHLDCIIKTSKLCHKPQV